VKKFENFTNESNSDIHMWYVGKGRYEQFDITNCLCKRFNDYYVQFTLPYNSHLFNLKEIKRSSSSVPRCYGIMKTHLLKRLLQVKYSCVKNATNRLKNILDIEIFSDDAVDYLDVSDTIDMISYLPKNKIKMINGLDPYNNKFRQEMKIGRFFRQHTLLDINQIELPVIEKLVSIYKYVNDARLGKHQIEVVEGEDIRKWYYYKNNSKGGTLGKSCMIGKKHQKLFDIYVENSKVCRMAIKRDDDNPEKIVGRALLWDTDKGIYMDRIYTSDEHHRFSFLGFADLNNWMTMDNYADKLNVKLIDKDFGPEFVNPYMDTFKYYYHDDNYLSNRRTDGFDYFYLDDAH